VRIAEMSSHRKSRHENLRAASLAFLFLLFFESQREKRKRVIYAV
jgi:hypothetical protein